MACIKKAILESLIIDGEGYTPEDQWTFTIGFQNVEPKAHLNGVISYKKMLEHDTATGGVVFESMTKCKELIEKDCGFTCTFQFSNGTALQFVDCKVVEHSSLDVDGVFSLVIAGKAQ